MGKERGREGETRSRFMVGGRAACVTLGVVIRKGANDA